MGKIINKTMYKNDLYSEKSKEIVKELSDLITKLKEENLSISTWFGRFMFKSGQDTFEFKNRGGYAYRSLENFDYDAHFPWFLLWEIAWIVQNNKFKKGDKVLDIGGASSLFSFYLASKGCRVTTIDLNKRLVENANRVAIEMGWDLYNVNIDAKEIKEYYISTRFDHVTSICVFEHIPKNDRIEICKNIKDLLKDNGKFSITFDYKNTADGYDINTKKDISEQFVKTTKLKVRGNKCFYDNNINYLVQPNDGEKYTFGSLFLKK